MDLLEVIINNKRYFEFVNEPLTNDQIQQLIAGAQLAPSLSEVQNFTYIIIDNQEIKDQLASFAPNHEYIKDAAIIFAVVVVTDDEDDTNIIDAIIASQQLSLIAISMGLGYNLIVDFEAERAAEVLNVQDPQLEIVALIPVGKTKDKGSQGIKRKMAELSNYNKLGIPFEFE